MKKADIKKWVKLAVIVAVFAILLVLPQPVQHHTAFGQGYGYGYDEGEPPPPTTGGGVGGVTTSGGEFTKETIFKSDDENLTLTIPKGTIGQTKAGDPLPEVRITKALTPPAPPQDKGFIGLSYDLEPDGATFEPSITITFTYNPNWIPAGLGPENLTVGYYDQDNKQWVMLDAKDITIDPKTNTISASISHFTYYSVMAHTAPAEFTISDLTVSPSDIEIAEQSTISAVVANAGDVSGKTKVTLKINGVTVASKIVEVIRHPKIPEHKDLKLNKEEFDRIVTWLDLNAVYYPTYACAYPESLTGRSPLDNRQLARLGQLAGIPIGPLRDHGSNRGPQVSFDRPESSPCLAKFTDKNDPNYQEALSIIRAGKEMLGRRPRADMPGFQPCEVDLRREQKYARRRQAELRNREATRTGEKVYDRTSAESSQPRG